MSEPNEKPEKRRVWNNRDVRGLAYMLPLIFLCIVFGHMVKPRHSSLWTQMIHNNEAEVREFLPEPFDPNTVTYEELRDMGVPVSAAASVVRARAYGKVYRINEDLAVVYGFTDSLYQALKPYIRIGEEYRIVPRTYENGYGAPRGRREVKYDYRPFRIDTVSAAYLSTIGFSMRQAEVFVSYRDRSGGLYSMADVAKCYVVDSVLCDTLERYIIFPERGVAPSGLIDINSADSAVLRRIAGIGEKSVGAILEYRRRLGGFSSVMQLAEVGGVRESNFEKILTQIYCDSCNISKIDINFATQAQLSEHPYISKRALRRLLNKRQLKGGWSRIEELIEDGIFDQREAEALRPYLRFTHDPESK